MPKFYPTEKVHSYNLSVRRGRIVGPDPETPGYWVVEEDGQTVGSWNADFLEPGWVAPDVPAVLVLEPIECPACGGDQYLQPCPECGRQ